MTTWSYEIIWRASSPPTALSFTPPEHRDWLIHNCICLLPKPRCLCSAAAEHTDRQGKWSGVHTCSTEHTDATTKLKKPTCGNDSTPKRWGAIIDGHCATWTLYAWRRQRWQSSITSSWNLLHLQLYTSVFIGFMDSGHHFQQQLLAH